MSAADLGSLAGAPIAGHALREALGGERVNCPGDKQVENRVKQVIRLVMQNPTVLKRYLKPELQRLHRDFSGHLVRVITPRGTQQGIPARLLDSTWRPDHVSITGMYPFFLPHYADPRRTALKAHCFNRTLAPGS